MGEAVTPSDGSAPPDDPVVTLAHVSDVHLGADDADVVDALVADVAAAGPDATVITGDLTMRARDREFARARDLLARLPHPRLVVLGNHDVPLYDVAERMTDPYDNFQDGVQDDLDPVLDLPGARVLGLQSQPRWRWKSGRVSKRQARLVADVLGSTPEGRVRVLALHHPPSLDGLERMAGLGRLRRALHRARVDLVLAGHTHVPSVTALEVPDEAGPHLVVEVVAGTGGSTRLRGVPASWTCITVTTSSIRVVPRFWSGTRWADGDITTVDRRTGVARH